MAGGPPTNARTRRDFASLKCYGAQFCSEINKNYLVPLETARCHFGGFRWWWNCPRSGRRVRDMHLPPGETMFVARTVYGLPYRREREGALDRSHTRQRRPYAKMSGEYRMFEDPRHLADRRVSTAEAMSG